MLKRFVSMRAVLLVVSCFACGGHSIDLLENFAPKLKTKHARTFTRSTTRQTAEVLANSYGYECETHDVITEDGYILTLHRVRRKNDFPSNNNPISMPPALLLHGFLASSDTWMFRGKDRDLPYVFADNGYDMWVLNARGNVYSRRHVSYDPDADEEFWNFSFHEMGLYDLPAAIDYILKITRQKDLFFTGHSMGCTAFFIMCSLKPQYNRKVKLMMALAPAVTITPENLRPSLKVLMSAVPMLVGYLKERRSFEIFPQRKFNGRLGKLLCGDESPTQKLCLTTMFSIVGSDYEQFNASMFPVAFAYYPSGTSLDTLMHMYKLYKGHFDYTDKDSNGDKDQDKPSKRYDLSRVTTPTAIFYGDGDVLVSKHDNEALAGKLPIVDGVYRVPHPHFNHLDFMWASNSSVLLYKFLVELMNKYR